MPHHTNAWAVALCLLNATAYAQEPIDADEGRKKAVAVRVAEDAIRIDGRLLEEVWQDAPAVTDFIQKEPIEGAAPTDRMEVRFAYDDGALYVGARMFSADPSTIQAPLGRRDEIDTQAESMFVSLDTYRDRRTAYTFGVSASGVRYDRHYPRDEEEVFDNTYEPVWEARTSIDAQGWTAEMWIPLAQLRFSDQPVHVWGLNIGRFIPTLDERVYWVPIPRTEKAWASRFGNLSGINGISRGRRLELLPVVVGSSTMNATRDHANPFDDGRNLAARVGTDLRMGLGPYLTLNATFNPDFGQVEADPAEVNLSAFATRFPEKRPFFTEGAALFNTANQRKFFYSRLIGARPVGPASDDFVDYPQEATILAAGKVSGRLQSRTSVAVLGAVTSAEYARLGNTVTGAIAKTRVEPYVAYGVGRVQQEFGQSGSTVAFEVGTTHRSVEKGDPLANLLIRNALTYGGDMYLRLKGGEYELVWGMMGTLLTGEPEALEVRQRAPEHFLQRPDKDYALLDPNARSMSGFSQTLNFTRLSGRHWLFGVQTVYDTVGHDVTQLGQMSAADGIQPSANITYRETIPGPVFRNYSIRVSQSNEWNHGWNRQTGLLSTTVNLTWANFWTTSVTAGRNLLTNNATLTRGGPLMRMPAGWTMSGSFGNNPSAQTRFTGSVNASQNDLGGKTRRAIGTLAFRPGPQWQLSIAPTYERLTDAQQYVSTLDGGRPVTYGNRYVFSYIDRSTASTEFRLGFTLRPDVNLDVYAEPFAASGRYYDFGELLAPGSLERIFYGSDGTSSTTLDNGDRVVSAGGSSFTLRNRDFNIRSFQSNVVLRWEWRPGSSMYVVWQQNRDAREVTGAPVGFGDMARSLRAPGSNIFMVKTSVWLPVN